MSTFIVCVCMFVNTFILSMENAEPPQKKRKAEETQESSLAEQSELDNIYLTFQTRDKKTFIIRKDYVPHFSTALAMKEGTSEIPIITLPDIEFTVMKLVVDLLEAEAVFKLRGYDPFEQYEKMYILLQKQKKYDLKIYGLSTWFELFNQLEYLGLSSATIDACVRLFAKCHAKTLLSERKNKFDEYKISAPAKKTLGKWFYRYAFKQGLIPNAATDDEEDPSLLDAMIEQNPSEKHLSFAAFLVASKWIGDEDYYRGEKFCFDCVMPEDEDDLIVADGLAFDDQIFDYNIKKFCKKLLVDNGAIETIDIRNSTMLAQKGFQYFNFITAMGFHTVNFPYGIHPEIFKNIDLKKVVIVYSNLTHLPKQLFKSCNNLAHVDIRHNQLTHLHPKLFESNRALRELHLANNPWTEQKDWKSLPEHARKAAQSTGFLAIDV